MVAGKCICTGTICFSNNHCCIIYSSRIFTGLVGNCTTTDFIFSAIGNSSIHIIVFKGISGTQQFHCTTTVHCTSTTTYDSSTSNGIAFKLNFVSGNTGKSVAICRIRHVVTKTTTLSRGSVVFKCYCVNNRFY